MSGFVSRLVGRLRAIFMRDGTGGGSGSAESWALVDDVLRAYHFTLGAREWLHDNIRVQVDDPASTAGGGYWQPDRRLVRLFTGQHEAAVHELAHAWWHDRRGPLKERMIEATIRLSAEKDPDYRALQRLAYGYVHGIPEQPWEGLLVTKNDWEMFAGLASGSMGDMRLLPPYVRELYTGLFELPGKPKSPS